MRLDVLVPLGSELAASEVKRELGAVVARAARSGGLTLELGPADGAPLLRISMTKAEAQRLTKALDAIIKGRDEEILL